MTGKQFEQEFQLACAEQSVLAIRLRDAGYQGNKFSERRFTIKNICDFIVFDNYLLLAMELKHRKQSLAFKDITQYKDLRKVNEFIESNNMHRATAGLLVCFGSLERVWWIHIAAIDELRDMTGKKSFNHKDCMLLSEEHPSLVFAVDTVLPPRKKKPRIDMHFTKSII